MNNKAQVGPIGAVMLFFVFLIMWFIWLGEWISEVGQIAMQEFGSTGVEGFFFSNLNFVIFICMVLGILGWMYFGGSQ